MNRGLLNRGLMEVDVESFALLSICFYFRKRVCSDRERRGREEERGKRIVRFFLCG